MMKRALMAAGLAAVLAGGSAVALAQGPQRGPGVHGHRGPGGMRGPAALFGLRGLDLTDAQREQVRTITQSHQAESEQVRTKLRAAHEALAAASRAETIDEAAIRARSAEVGAAMADAALLQAKIRGEVVAILTPEQLQKATELRAQAEARRGKMQERRSQLRERRRQ